MAKLHLIYLYVTYTLYAQPVENTTMLMKRKLNISIFTAFAAALLLLATDVFASNYGKNQSDTVILPN